MTFIHNTFLEKYLDVERLVFVEEMILAEECCSDYLRFGEGVHCILLGIMLRDPSCSSY